MMHDGAELLFCQSKPIAFLPFLLMSSLLKLPIIPVWEGGQVLNGTSLTNYYKVCEGKVPKLVTPKTLDLWVHAQTLSHFVCLHPCALNGYQQYTAESNPKMDIQEGGIEILLVTSCFVTRDKLWPGGPLGSHIVFTFKGEDYVWTKSGMGFRIDGIKAISCGTSGGKQVCDLKFDNKSNLGWVCLSSQNEKAILNLQNLQFKFHVIIAYYEDIDGRYCIKKNNIDHIHQ